MKRIYFVEPVVAVYSFASFILYPLVQQYVYRRLWMEITNTSYPALDISNRCDTNSSNHSSHHKEVQKAASLFSMYSNLFTLIPGFLMTLILVAYSDQRGRKITIILPLIGSLIYSLAFLTVSFFELNLYLLIVASFINALFGGIGTMLGGCFSYVADMCEDGKQKTLRMAGVDMVIGLFSGVALISSGYFLRETGFNWPLFTSAVAHLINLLYAVFLLGESRVIDNTVAADSGSRCLAARKLIFGICNVFSQGSRRRTVLLVLLIVILCSFSFANFGGLSVVTLYELNEPLCWSEILIGYGSALSTTVFVTSFIGVYVLSQCLPDLLIVLIGILSVFIGMVMMAFAKTTLMMFLVRIPMLFAIMPFPVLRSVMSKVVSKSEQGALFACVAVIDSLSANLASAAFESVYSTTVAWCPGFTFLLAAGLCFIPMGLLGTVRLFRLVDVAETERLLPEEDTPTTEDTAEPVA